MKKSLETINAQLAAIDITDIKNAKKLLAKVNRLKEQKKVAVEEKKFKAPSAAAQVAAIVSNYSDNITSGIMAAFTQKEFCKEYFGIRYPLFVEIPSGASNEDIKKLRHPNEDKNARYSTEVWTFKNIPNHSFMMTNDLYQKHINAIHEGLKKFC